MRLEILGGACHSEVWHADLAREELRDDGDPEGEHEEDVGEAHLVAAGKLVRLPPNLLLAEAHGEDHRRQAEQQHGRKAHPSGVGQSAAVPARQAQQHGSGCDADAAQHDAHQGQQPLRLQSRWKTALGTSLKRCARLQQAQASVPADIGDNPVGQHETHDGENIGSEKQHARDHRQFVHCR